MTINKTKNILVLCTGNSCRSQMAEGYLHNFAKGKAKIYSAGIEERGVHPKAIQVMKEDGIDISSHISKNINEYVHIDFDFIITVCDNARENCPHFSSKAKKFHHNFPNPATAMGSEEAILNRFRKVRDMIKSYIEKFVKQNIG